MGQSLVITDIDAAIGDSGNLVLVLTAPVTSGTLSSVADDFFVANPGEFQVHRASGIVVPAGGSMSYSFESPSENANAIFLSARGYLTAN